MGKKDTFSLTSIPTDVKDAASSKKVQLESKKAKRAPDKNASVDIERLKQLHQERMERYLRFCSWVCFVSRRESGGNTFD